MGQLVDLDEVLKVIPPNKLNNATKEKLEKLAHKPCITYSGGWTWNEDTRYKSEEHELACCMLMAFRYAVNRHGTQALYRMDLHKIIEDNFSMFCDDFIRQMIQDIQREFRWTENDPASSYPVFHIDYLVKDLMEGIQYLLEKGKIEETKKLTDIVIRLKELGRDVEWLENALREPIRKVEFDRDASYLKPFYEALQVEYERRGYKRLEDW